MNYHLFSLFHSTYYLGMVYCTIPTVDIFYFRAFAPHNSCHDHIIVLTTIILLAPLMCMLPQMNSLSAFIHIQDSQTNFLISIESKLNFNSRLSSEQETFQNSYDTINTIPWQHSTTNFSCCGGCGVVQRSYSDPRSRGKSSALVRQLVEYQICLSKSCY